MKSSKELFERLKTDEAFVKEFSEAVIAKKEAGAANYFETVIPAAADFGYEISEEEVQAIADAQNEEISEEDLGKVAGGTSCLPLSVGVTLLTFTITSMVSVTVSIATQK